MSTEAASRRAGGNRDPFAPIGASLCPDAHVRVEDHPASGGHASKGIVTQSWSPLGQGGGELEDPVITQIADAHGATPAQVLISWNLALGNVVIPKSVTPERIASNFASLELTLTEDELAQINALDKGTEGRIAADPAVSDFA